MRGFWRIRGLARSSPTTWSRYRGIIDKGWHDARVRARGPFQLDPASAVLHYAQEIFEGMKAYRTDDGGDRPVPAGGKRPPLPALGPAHGDAGNAGGAVPRGGRAAGPHRPRLGALRRRAASICGPSCSPAKRSSACARRTNTSFCVIASPVGAYFKGGEKPVAVWVSDDYTRAAPGGTGAAKCGGNYAASLIAQAEAAAHGCDQVVFLDAAEHRWVEELGGMNIFFVMDDGTHRDAAARHDPAGHHPRLPDHARARRRHRRSRRSPTPSTSGGRMPPSGRLREAFACGTAAVVAPIGSVRHAGGEFTIGGGEVGPVTRKLRETLVGMQRGIARGRLRLAPPDLLSGRHRQSARRQRNGNEGRVMA